MKRLRRRNAPPVTLRIPTVGWSFQVEGKSVGRLIPVFQSSSVRKSSLKYSKVVSAGLSGSTITTGACGRWLRKSVTWRVFRQFQRPIRRGVARLSDVLRLSERSVSACSTPPMGGSSTTTPGPWLKA